MARRTGPRIKLSRRYGLALFSTPKEAKILARRGYPPGQHGQSQTHRLSGYGLQLREKQKAKLVYGILERQFRNYVTKVRAMKGNTGALLIEALERRLDNVIYRLGFASTRAQARQFVTHGHIQVNGKGVNIPSYQVAVNERISLRPESVNKKIFTDLTKRLESYNPPSWLQLDREHLVGQVNSRPTLEETERLFDLQLIVEFYSR